MSKNQNPALDEYEVDGQMSLYDYIEKPLLSPMIAVSKIFARAIKQMTIAEWKTFVFALTHIRWTEKNNNVIRMDKKDLAKILEIEADADHLSFVLKRALGDLPKHSFVKFSDGSDWINGTFITQVACFKNIVRVKFEEDYMPLFEELDKERNYITMWADDLFGMRSARSILFYEQLRLHSDTRKENTRIFSTRELKEMFGIPKTGEGSYMRKDGHLQRTQFERKVIYPICEDLMKCRMIQLAVNEDGKPFRKVKKDGQVVGYEFAWSVSDRQRILPGSEAPQLINALNENPEIAKIAKDIKNGKKRSKKNEFNEFEQREYDENMERLLLQSNREND